MREAERSAIVPYTPAAMYALVADIARYPEFLPGCTGSRVIESVPGSVLAELSLAKGPLHARFTTRNTLDAPHGMKLALIEGPFRVLEGEWQLTPLGDTGATVRLRMKFEFENRATDLLLGGWFESACDGIVDAFVRRARQVYG